MPKFRWHDQSEFREIMFVIPYFQSPFPKILLIQPKMIQVLFDFRCTFPRFSSFFYSMTAPELSYYNTIFMW